MHEEGAERVRRVLTTTPQVRAAVVEIAERAERALALFSHGLEPDVYDQLAFVDAVTNLVLAHAHARVRILLVDPTHLVQDDHRLVELGRRLVSFVEFRRVHRDHRAREDGFLIADDHSLLHLAQATHPYGAISLNDRHMATKFLRQFDEIWQRSGPEREARRLSI
jgi:hypothetical protein